MRTLAILLSLAAGAVAGALAVLLAGVYDVSAIDQHLRPTFWALQTGLRQSVKQRAAAIEPPPLDDPALAARGLHHFRAHCVQCHGAPGVAPEPFALGLTPLPGSLSDTAREWTASQIYWVVRNGIKMTAMPAWQFRMSDEELWSIVAFLKTLPGLSPQEYRDSRAAGPIAPAAAPGSAPDAPAPDANRGRRALRQFGCVGCHVIPGVVAAESHVGPPLQGIGTRTFVAGQLPNTRENLIQWIRHPQAISPGSAMPDLGVGERDARDMAAYLERLR
ncbi:MAG: c-type cytochrome [Burkholderiaceae bacterium]|nr:c-type cytochrome [Burkholderiaceae bacterium]